MEPTREELEDILGMDKVWDAIVELKRRGPSTDEIVEKTERIVKEPEVEAAQV